MPSEQNKDWILAESHYCETFVAALQKGDTYATQFHPEKSGAAGLTVLKNFFESYTGEEPHPAPVMQQLQQQHVNGGYPATPLIMLTKAPCTGSPPPPPPPSQPFTSCMTPEWVTANALSSKYRVIYIPMSIHAAHMPDMIIIESTMNFNVSNKLRGRSKPFISVVLLASVQAVPPSYIHAAMLVEARASAGTSQGLAKRVIACLDVRANDAGDLVVTKGDQYDVRDQGTAAKDVRNLGLPVQLAGRYFVEGADEVTFLNITGFRDFPLGDLPMLEVGSGTSLM